MALSHVKREYYIQLNYYLECKRDLADFEIALKDGYITEDRLAEIYAETAEIERNYIRVANLLFELERPKNKKKAAKWEKQNKELIDAFKELKADSASIEDENISLLKSIKEHMAQIQAEIDNKNR